MARVGGSWANNTDETARGDNKNSEVIARYAGRAVGKDLGGERGATTDDATSDKQRR